MDWNYQKRKEEALEKDKRRVQLGGARKQVKDQEKKERRHERGFGQVMDENVSSLLGAMGEFENPTPVSNEEFPSEDDIITAKYEAKQRAGQQIMDYLQQEGADPELLGQVTEFAQTHSLGKWMEISQKSNDITKVSRLLQGLTDTNKDHLGIDEDTFNQRYNTLKQEGLDPYAQSVGDNFLGYRDLYNDMMQEGQQKQKDQVARKLQDGTVVRAKGTDKNKAIKGVDGNDIVRTDFSQDPRGIQMVGKSMIKLLVDGNGENDKKNAQLMQVSYNGGSQFIKGMYKDIMPEFSQLYPDRVQHLTPQDGRSINMI